MASLTERVTLPEVPARDQVPGAEYLYLFLFFPGISVFLGIPLYHVATVLFIAFVFLLAVRGKRLQTSWTVLVALSIFATFLLYSAVSMWWSSSSEYALYKFTRLAVACTLLMLAPAVVFPDEERLYNFLKLALYASVLVAAVIVFGYFSPAYTRPYEIYGSASHIRPGRTIGFGIVVATHYVVAADQPVRRYVHGLMLAVLLLGITVSESRGPLVAAAGSSTILILSNLYVTRGEKYRAYQFLLAVILGFVSLIVLHTAFGISIPTFDRIVPLLQGDLDPSSSNRLVLFYNGLMYWLESPVFGNGLGSFAPWYFGEDTMGYPHNFVLEILAELGLIGLLIFGSLLVVVFRPIAANYRARPIAVLLFSLLVYALINASLSKDLQGNRILFGVIGLAACLELFSEYER